ncbi:MAG: insulinase family protein [Deltaproteobacteria bacterium]|nr:insulinase family protein [Deltaproteobacteria bacterium]
MYTRYRDVLDNGLRVVTLEVPHLHTALLAAYVRCGSRHETARSNGVSHFLEHMFFRGSERFPDTRVMNGLIEEAGGDLNGYTMRDQGLYFTPLHPKELPVGFEVMGDMLGAPLLKQMEVEREVILEEMMDEVDAAGRDVDLGNLSKRLVFGRHPLSYKIAGTPRTVRALKEADLREHHLRYYVASNMVLTVAGPVERRRVLDLADKAFGRLPRGRPVQEEPPSPATRGPKVLFVPDVESQTELMVCFPCPPEDHPDFLALTLMRAVLDDGLTSWLPLNIVERRGLAYSVHAAIDAFSDAAVFELEAACSPGKVIPVFEEMVRLLGQLRATPLAAEDLARVKRRHRMGLDFMLDDLNALAGWYGGGELFRMPETFEQKVQRLESVTAEQIQQVAERTFSRRNLHVLAVGRAAGRAAQRLERAAREAEL